MENIVLSGHVRYENVTAVDGFAAHDAIAGEQVKMLVKAFVDSDSSDFYVYADKLSDLYLGKHFLVNLVHSFLILVHEDLSADIFVNNIPSSVRVIGARDIRKGEGVTIKDIADISQLRFDGIDIVRSDRIIYCFKVGWKFGLYFNLTRSIDTAGLSTELGRHYRYLLFKKQYSIIENTQLFERLMQDGWFPFIQLLGGDFDRLAEAYKYVDSDKPRFAAFVENLLVKFDRYRVDAFTQYWWRIELFKSKKKIIEAAIAAFFENTEGGYISCIKNLYSEIEGIIRIDYYDTFKKQPSFKQLKEHVISKAKNKFSDQGSLGFPDIFYGYLNDNIFADFNLETGDVQLSRHSSAHGVAKAEDYDRIRALQAILTLDQMRFYLF